MQNVNRAVGHGRYRARLAACAADVRAAQRLRHLAFVTLGGALPRPGGLDRDRCDARCRHVLVEEAGTGTLVCCFRLLHLRSGGQIERSYCAKYYDLSRLGNFPAPMLELGRFCLHPDHHHPDIMRTAWAAITRHVDQAKVEMLFGCSSFHGTWHRPSGDPGSGRPILSVFRSC
jgi:putative hemolysin